MADATGQDLLLKIFEGQEKLCMSVEELGRRMQRTEDRLTTQLNNTDGTLALIGRVLNELAVTTQERVADHKGRIKALEVGVP